MALAQFSGRAIGIAPCFGVSTGCIERRPVFGAHGPTSDSDSDCCASVSDERFSTGIPLGIAARLGAEICLSLEAIANIRAYLASDQQSDRSLAPIYDRDLDLACTSTF